jgi:hypothetical protein
MTQFESRAIELLISMESKIQKILEKLDEQTLMSKGKSAFQTSDMTIKKDVNLKPLNEESKMISRIIDPLDQEIRNHMASEERITGRN